MVYLLIKTLIDDHKIDSGWVNSQLVHPKNHYQVKKVISKLICDIET